MPPTPKPPKSNTPMLDAQRAKDDQRRAINNERQGMRDERRQALMGRAAQREMRRALRKGKSWAIEAASKQEGLPANFAKAGITDSVQEQKVAIDRANNKAIIQNKIRGGELLPTGEPNPAFKGNQQPQPAANNNVNPGNQQDADAIARDGGKVLQDTSRTRQDTSTIESQDPAARDKELEAELPATITQAPAAPAETATPDAEPSPAPSTTSNKGNARPSLDDEEKAARARSTAEGAFGKPFLNDFSDSKSKFAEDLNNSELIKNGNEEAIANAYARGEQLGVSRDKVQSYLGLETDLEKENFRQSGIDKKFNDVIGDLPKAIQDMLEKLSPQEREGVINKIAADKTIRETEDIFAPKSPGQKLIDQLEPFKNTIGGQAGLDYLLKRIKTANESSELIQKRKAEDGLEPSDNNSPLQMFNYGLQSYGLSPVNPPAIPSDLRLPKVDEKSLRDNAQVAAQAENQFLSSLDPYPTLGEKSKTTDFFNSGLVGEKTTVPPKATVPPEVTLSPKLEDSFFGALGSDLGNIGSSIGNFIFDDIPTQFKIRAIEEQKAKTATLRSEISKSPSTALGKFRNNRLEEQALRSEVKTKQLEQEFNSLNSFDQGVVDLNPDFPIEELIKFSLKKRPGNREKRTENMLKMYKLNQQKIKADEKSKKEIEESEALRRMIDI